MDANTPIGSGRHDVSYTSVFTGREDLSLCSFLSVGDEKNPLIEVSLYRASEEEANGIYEGHYVLP